MKDNNFAKVICTWKLTSTITFHMNIFTQFGISSLMQWGEGNLGGGRPEIAWVVMKRGQEGMSGRRTGSRMVGSTHVCGSVSGVVPNVVHQVGEVLQTVRDVVREQQDAHRLGTNTQGQRVRSRSVRIPTTVTLLCVTDSVYLRP